jgi:hypothetical protein
MTTKSHAKEHTIRLRVTDEELEWLRDEAARQERTIASLLRVVLRHYLDTKS